MRNMLSHSNPEVLLLRLHSFRILPHRKRRTDPPRYSLGPRSQSLPPPYTAILPICSDRAAFRRNTAGCAHCFRHNATLLSPPTGSHSLRRRDAERQTHNPLAACQRDQRIGFRFNTTSGLPSLDDEDITTIRAWRLSFDQPLVHKSWFCAP